MLVSLSMYHCNLIIQRFLLYTLIRREIASEKSNLLTKNSGSEMELETLFGVRSILVRTTGESCVFVTAIR